MKNTTIIKLIGYLLLILYNYYIYDLIKKIKKNQTCLKENKCNINYEEKKVSILKYIYYIYDFILYIKYNNTV